MIATALLLILAGCNPDADNDGLSNKEEEDLGTNPEKKDTDGDGLNDQKEVNLKTDPNEVDSDGDTYEDGWEVDEGTDPTDGESRIYTGYWPYNPDKDDIADPGWCNGVRGPCAEEGQVFPRLQWVDQFGDTFDNYDLAGHDRMIILDVSGKWCGYCKEMALWLEFESDFYTDFMPAFDQIRLMVEAGDLYWVTAVDMDGRQNPVDETASADWYEDYPNDNVPVVADTQMQLSAEFYIMGYPFLTLIDSDMTLVTWSNDDYSTINVFDEVLARYPDWVAPE